MSSSKYSDLYTRQSIGLIDDSSPADMNWLATWDIQKDLSTASAIEYFKIIVEIFSGGDSKPEKMLPLLLSDFQYDESRSIAFGHSRNKLFREISCKTTLNREYFERINFYGDDLLFPVLDIKKILNDYISIKRDEELVEFSNIEKRITCIEFFVSNIHSDPFKGFSFKLTSGGNVND
jgi:hypothetical protein